MKKSRFTKIADCNDIEETESGVSVKDICRDSVI